MKCISAAVLKSSAKKGIRESEGECRSVMSDSFDPMDCTVHGILQARILACALNGEELSLNGDLPHPWLEPGAPALQEDSLPSEPPGKSNFIIYLS